MNIFAAIKRHPDVERSSQLAPKENLDGFLSDLTAVCAKHGIGITGAPTLFVMEGEDQALRYAVDEDSNLVLA